MTAGSLARPMQTQIKTMCLLLVCCKCSWSRSMLRVCRFWAINNTFFNVGTPGVKSAGVTGRSFCRSSIGLYRDVWIASSRKSLATQAAAICVRFHGRRVRHVYVTMQITFLARKSALIYRRGLRQRVASLTIDCNGVSAIRAYRLLDSVLA